MSKSIDKHIEGSLDQIGVLLRKHKPKIKKMIDEAEGLDITIPIKLYVSDAPGAQRVDVTVTFTTKETFSSSVDIDTDQTRLEVIDKEAAKESKKARKKKGDDDQPE